jgi:glyoxylate reductase
VARRARAFGLQVVYHSRTARPDLERGLRLIPVTLDELWASSDFVSLHVPLSADTRHLVDAAALRRFKPTAHLVNTARGPIVDPIALAEALHAGRLAGAALDVTDPEPLPPDDPLLRAPNLIVLPHIGSATAGTRRKMAQLAVANVRAGLRGEPLPHCVNASAL